MHLCWLLSVFWILILFQNNCVLQHVVYVFLYLWAVIKYFAAKFEILKFYLLFFTAIFIQQCHFLRQAGHSEKAVSLFQALIDFTFFKPDSVKDLPTRGQVAISI